LNNSGKKNFIFDKIKYSSKFTIFLHKIFLLGKKKQKNKKNKKKGEKKKFLISTFLKII